MVQLLLVRHADITYSCASILLQLLSYTISVYIVRYNII